MTDHVTKVQQHKVDSLDAVKFQFTNNKDFIFTDYRGLTVKQITALPASFGK